MQLPSSLPSFRVQFVLMMLGIAVLAMALLPERSSSKQSDSALISRAVTTSNQFGVANASDVNQSGDYVFIPQGSSAIFLRKFSTGITSRIFQMREPVPGLPGTRSDLITSPRINGSGKVAFLSEYASGTGQFNRALLLFDGTNLQKIIISTDIAPNTGNSAYGRNLAIGGLNDAGDLALLAPLSLGTAPTLFLIPSSGSAVRVAGPGDPAPGTGGGTLSNIALGNGTNSLNSNGEVLFTAQVLGGGGGFGVFVGSALGVRKVVANGDSNPAGGTFAINGAIPARLNNFSGAAFVAASTIFTHNSEGGVSKAVGINDPAPASLGGTFSGQPTLHALNHSGVVAFSSNIAGSGVTSFGIFRFVPSATIETVAYVGQAAPASSGSNFANFNSGVTGVSINSSGMICFGANLVGGPFRAGIFQQAGVDTPVKVGLAGEPAPVPGGGNFVPATFGGTRVLDSGQVTFPSNIIGSGATFAEFIGTPGNLTPLMHDNDSLPVGSLTSLRTFRAGAAGDYVGFLAQQAGGRVSLMVRNINSGVTSTVFTDGDAAPGAPGFRLRNTAQNTVHVNSNGTIVFTALIIGGNVGLSNGIFTATTNGSLTKVIAEGDLDPTTNLPFSGLSINFIAPAPLNNAGQVLFRGLSQSQFGFYVASESGSIQRIARTSEAAPGGGTFSSFSTVASINQAGQVAFFANTVGGPGQNQGIFVGSPGGGVTRIAVSGDPAPGGGSFFRFPVAASLNDSGEVAFVASLGPAGATGGVFSGSSQATLLAIALHGSPSPAGGTFQINGTSLDIMINNQQDIAFRSALSGASGDSGYFIRRGPSAPLQTVVLQGQAAPGIAGTFSTMQSSPNLVLAELLALGPTGELAFSNALQLGGLGVFGTFRFRTDNLLEKIIVRGDVMPGTGNGISAGTSTGFGIGSVGRFALWVPIIGGNGEDLIYVTNSPTGFGISGQVKDVNGAGISGVIVNLSGDVSGSTTTNAGGNYSFANLATGGNYVMTPASGNYSFDPSSQSFNNLTSARVANFVGTQTLVNINGNVVDVNDAPLNNVTMVLTKDGVAAGTTTTNSLGNYSFANQTAAANYVVTPAGNFTPSSQTLSSLTTDASVNFKAAPSIPSQCNSASFAAATNFAAGTSPSSVAVGDVNADGNLDFAVANEGTANVSILLGTGTGSFASSGNFAVGTRPQSVALSDLNGDGILDLAVPNADSNNVSILLGSGTGSFGVATNFAVGTSPHPLAVGDFDGDANPDLAVPNQAANTVSILLGTGTGSFGGATNLAVGSAPRNVALGDFNSDGHVDIATANINSGNVSILLGTGTGSFGAVTNFATASQPAFVAVGDFNGDGKHDLAVPSNNTNQVTILLGSGTGSFSAATNFAGGSSPMGLTVGDLNGDGKSDLVLTNNANTISILLGTGAGGFVAESVVAVGSNSFSAATGDFNDDGKPDLGVANYTSNNVSVLLNNGATCNLQSSLTISGRVAVFNSAPLSDVTVTLSGPITRVVQTDANGNYSFANLAPGGNYAVTVQSPHYVFAPSRADFFNLGSSQTANFTAAPVAVPVPTPPLSDNFATPVRDASKWNLGTQTQPVGAFDPQVTTAQINGQLIITPLNQASGSHFNGYVSANSFDLTNGKASVELVRAAPGGADTIFAIGRDSNNFFRFQVHTAGGPSSPVRFYRGLDGVERALDATTSQLLLTVAVQGQLQTLPITYDPVAHRHLRFRHESAQLAPPLGAIVFEASPNGVDYTVLHRVQLANRVVDPMTLELSAGTANPTGTGSAIFDNVGLVLSTFQFSAASYTVGEGDGEVVITVTRTGTLTETATVEFVTADGTAEQRTKYVNATGTLSFAAGETTKTFTVLIVNNVLTEGNQTANLLLEEPDNAGLNSPGRAVLNIIDNDTVTATGNPLDDPTYFVTQQYYDFLNRVADPGGSAFWIDQITSCPPGNQECVNARRIRVSHAFFFEQEFQQTGAFVFRLYRAAFGNQQPFPNPFPDANHPGEAEKVPSYAVFVADRARVIGGSELTQTQLQLANDFVERGEFKMKYPAHLDGPAFITALLQTIQTSTAANLSSQQSVLQALFTQGGRGLVLFHVANDYWNNCHRLPGSPPAPCVPPGVGPALDNRPFIDAEYRRVFVTTQYFGYLRRDADLGGLLFWLDQVNRFPLRDQNIQNAMVCSFITSAEYQQRFSPVVTHTNQECPQ